MLDVHSGNFLRLVSQKGVTFGYPGMVYFGIGLDFFTGFGHEFLKIIMPD